VTATSKDQPAWRHAIRPFTARPYLLIAAVLGVVAFLIAGLTHLAALTRGLIGWDLGVVSFLALTFRSMIKVDLEQMKQRAADVDQGKYATLALTIIAAVASVAAIAGELVSAKGQPGQVEAAQVALATVTIALSWVFAHIVFALHYAHVYYLGDKDAPAAKPRHRGGLDFPNEKEPDYWDFVHFALVIGAAAQTADIEITSRHMRRLATAHTLVAFTFNTAILAVMINVVASLLQ
jgi:uncharacterized membrane protein